MYVPALGKNATPFVVPLPGSFSSPNSVSVSWNPKVCPGAAHVMSNVTNPVFTLLSAFGAYSSAPPGAAVIATVFAVFSSGGSVVGPVFSDSE